MLFFSFSGIRFTLHIGAIALETLRRFIIACRAIILPTFNIYCLGKPIYVYIVCATGFPLGVY